MTYDNIESHKKPGLHPLLRRYIFWKKHRGGVKLTPPAKVTVPSTAKVTVPSEPDYFHQRYSNVIFSLSQVVPTVIDKGLEKS